MQLNDCFEREYSFKVSNDKKIRIEKCILKANVSWAIYLFIQNNSFGENGKVIYFAQMPIYLYFKLFKTFKM